MIAALAGFFVARGASETAGRIAAWGVAAVVAVALLAFFLGALRQDAVRDERRAAEAARLTAELAQRGIEHAADGIRRAELERAARAAAERGKEIDDATRWIPDQAPSPRQRARLCVELRRQGAADGELAAACGPARPR